MRHLSGHEQPKEEVITTRRFSKLLVGLPQELFEMVVDKLSLEDFRSLQLASNALVKASSHVSTRFLSVRHCMLADSEELKA